MTTPGPAIVDPEGAGFDPNRLERLTEHFESRYVSSGKIAGCQIAVARWGKTAYWRSLGLMDVERAKPVEDDTVWRIYSMTKPITSVALMQLYEQGCFQLSDPLHRYIPEWRGLSVGELGPDGSVRTVDAVRPPSVRDALTHMTGLAGGVSPGHPIDTAVRRGAARLPARHDPRGDLLAARRLPAQVPAGHAVELRALDRRLRPAGRDPLGPALRRVSPGPHLRAARAWPTPATSCPTGRRRAWPRATRYQRGGRPELVDDPEHSPYRRPRSFLSGASGLVSTTADYLRFCQMLVNRGQLDGHRIIGRKTLELMATNHLPDDGELGRLATGGFGEAEFPGVGFGLGFGVGRGPGATASAGSVGEFYWGGAASTAFWVDPVEDLTVVFMTQLLPSATYPFRSQLRALVYQALAD